MAVFLITGVPGSGKSAWTTENVVLKNLQQKKRKVITNISLNVQYLTEILEIDEDLIRIVESKKGDFSDTFLHKEDYLDDWRNEKGQAPVVIVDEAHFSLNKQRKKNEVLEIEEFFSTHRQAGYDIYLITQDRNRLPRDILGFIDTNYEITKQRQMGSQMFTCYVRDGSGRLIGSKTRPYNKEIFKCYKSHLLSDGEVDEDHQVAGVKSIWLAWPFLSLYALIAVMSYGFIFLGWSLNPFAFLEKEKEKQLKQDVDLANIEFETVDTSQSIAHSNTMNLDNVQYVQEVKPEEPKEIKYLNQNHPLDNKLFQIRSWIGNIAFISIYDKETSKKVSSIKSSDLQRMGYVVEEYSECSMKLIYENVNFFIDCSNIEEQEKSTADRVLGGVPTI
ncbi:DUF2075 domain-containing protein [Vibrio sp. B511a]|uniref:zonular occludens toxin domain-containing protein n=1 Tax=Vibrio sp. B511a TaxID=2835905 RepID=UPI002555C248|nr:zonular occludens toxin domain-containing protein [Vibrio sp. B511a]MDK9734474.1 DUF2075 domain-containing protein [Vibrio sp. B511a]